jgi:Zn-dependent protease with chaperone function
VQFLIIIAFGMIMLVDQFESPIVIAPGLAGAVAVITSVLALTMIWIRGIRKRIFHALESGHLPIGSVQNIYVRGQNGMKILAMVGQSLLIFCTQWPDVVRQTLGTHIAGLDELVMILPFVFWLMTGYFFLYPADRAIRESMIGQMLAISEAVHPIWSRRQFLDFQLRFQLLLIGAPLMLIVAVKDIFDIPAVESILFKIGKPILTFFHMEKFNSMIPEMALACLAGIIFLLAPILIKIIWKTQPLPKGQLREALERSAKLAGLKYKDILLWPTHGVIVNAAVVGFFAPIRYILLSDGLIESLTDGQIQGVFGHEIGHVKLHHLPYLLVFAIASMGLIGLAVMEAQIFFHLDPNTTQLIILGAIMLVWFFAFGFVSRRFEAQADLFGAKLLSEDFDLVGCSYENCQRHRTAQVTLMGNRPLCLGGAELFSSALDRTAGLNAIPRKANSWRHGSIFNRCTFVVQAATDFATLKDFYRQVRYVKIALLFALLVTAIWGVGMIAKLNHSTADSRPPITINLPS